MSNKVGRNDPCPCGSGRKYKKCCLGKGMQVSYETPGGRVKQIKPLIPDLTLLCLNPEERDLMRAACKFNAQLMDQVRFMIEPGRSPKEIDDFVRTYTQDHGHKPATLGYGPQDGPFPASCCTSPNHVVCHGIPLIQKPLSEGDIVNVDLTTIVEGWHGDQSETFFVGEVNDQARQLTQASFDAMWAAIDALTPNCRVSVIGKAIVEIAEAHEFSVVEAFTGHGVGRQFHNNLTIPHYPTKPAMLTKLPPGITFTIEPMLNAGLKDVVLEGDGWSVTTADRSLSAQHEHTILMTEEGPEVLTLTKHGPQRGHRF